MIVTEPNSDRVFEIRTWRFPSDTMSASFFLALEHLMKQTEHVRSTGCGAYRHRTPEGDDWFVTLIGEGEGIDELGELPRPYRGEEIDDLDYEVASALLQKRLKVEAHVQLDRIDGIEGDGKVVRTASYGRRGALITPEGNIVPRIGGDQ